MDATRSITSISSIVAALPSVEQTLFDRFFDIQTSQVHLRIPDSMRSWVISQFDSVEHVARQQTVKITNRWTLECTLFNDLRARRPLQGRPVKQPSISGDDPFAFPELLTPVADFMRIRGESTITAGNVAAYDGVHGVLIFQEADPMAFTEDAIIDMVDVARRWFTAARETHPEASYPLLIWNCSPRAGASIAHGHAQVTLTSGQHYGGVERVRRASTEYHAAYGTNYFNDLIRIYDSLGLAGCSNDCPVCASLTPCRENECILLADAFDESFARALYKLLSGYVTNLKVQAFNLAVYLPPATASNEQWVDFPIMARLVDRGDPMNPVSDVAAMELFACSVVSSDPFVLTSRLFR